MAGLVKLHRSAGQQSDLIRSGPETADITWKNQYPLKGSLFLARCFFFFGQSVVPRIIAQTQLAWERLGFPDADLAAVVQEVLNKRIIRGFFGDFFHEHMTTPSRALVSRLIWGSVAQIG